MREGISKLATSGTNLRIVWTGAILVVVGLSVLLLAAEWFAGFDACVASPVCNAGATPDTLEGYLALIVAGVALGVAGVTIALPRGAREPRPAIIT